MGILCKECPLNRVTYTSTVGGLYIQWDSVYIQWDWRIHSMGVVCTSNRGGTYIQCGWRIRPMGVAHTSSASSAYIQWGWRISTMDLYFQWAKKFNTPLDFLQAAVCSRYHTSIRIYVYWRKWHKKIAFYIMRAAGNLIYNLSTVPDV